MGEALATIVKRIEDAGTSIGGFGGTWNGGYSSQQVPSELAEAIYFLQHQQLPSPRNYLEIGAAAGGTTRLMCELIGFDNVHIIDNNNDGMVDQDGRKLWTHRTDNIPHATEWVGDSHSEACRLAVDAWGVAFDVILVDGDHYYDGVRQDTDIALSLANPGAWILFHDVLADSCKDVRRWADEMNAGKVPGLDQHKLCGTRLGIGIYRWQP